MNITLFTATYIRRVKSLACVLAIIALPLLAGCAAKKDEPKEEETHTRSYDEYYGQYIEYMTERGRALVRLGGCSECHTPKIKTTLGYKPDNEKFLSGYPQDKPLPDLPYKEAIYGKSERSFYTTDATIWVGRWGVSFAANLTPDTETGLGDVSESEFIEIFRQKKRARAEKELAPPMPFEVYSSLTDTDLRAIYIFLRSIEPVSNKVPDPITPDTDAFGQGT